MVPEEIVLPGDNKAAAAQIKTMSQRRQAEKAQKQELERVTGLIPIEGENLEDAYNADVMLEEARAAEVQASAEQKKKESDAYTYFVRCRKDHVDPKNHRKRLPPHGIYLDVNPGTGFVEPGQWVSRYKPDRKTPWYEDIVCQVCLWTTGEMVPLEVQKDKKGRFTVSPRQLWRRPKDAERLKLEGETRANEIGPKSCNMDREAAMKRAEDAGLERV